MICGCQRKCDEWQTWLPICVMLYVIKQGCQYVCAACCFLGDWLFTVRPALTIPASCCEWGEKPRRLDHICARWQAQSSCMFVVFFIHTVCAYLLSETSKTEVVLMFLMWRGGCWAIRCGGATLVINTCGTAGCVGCVGCGRQVLWFACTMPDCVLFAQDIQPLRAWHLPTVVLVLQQDVMGS